MTAQSTPEAGYPPRAGTPTPDQQPWSRAGPGTASGGTRLAWEGDLDIASGPVLTCACGVLADLGVRTVVLDVSTVAFMDCSGVGALLEADARLPDGLTLVRPSRPVLRLLAMVGLADRFATTQEPAPPTGVPGTRACIEQSKGLIMGSFGCTSDQASKMLVSTALRHNVQVQVLAAALATVASTDLDHAPGGPAEAVRRVMMVADAIA